MRMDIGDTEVRTFMNDPMSIAYNTPLLTLGGGATIEKGTLFSATLGVAIEQTFVKSNIDTADIKEGGKMAEESTEAIADELSGVYLWKTPGGAYKDMRSISSWLLEVTGANNSKQVLAFVNSQWNASPEQSCGTDESEMSA